MSGSPFERPVWRGVLALRSLGWTGEEIAASMRVTRRTVTRVLSEAREWHQSIAEESGDLEEDRHLWMDPMTN